MKRVIFILACFLLVGCSSSNDSKLSMQSFVDAFEGEGIQVDASEKPMYSMIGAKDGVIFYNENNPVKIYQFDSEKDIKAAEEALPAAKDWEQNGLFLLETSDDEAKKIFTDVK